MPKIRIIHKEVESQERMKQLAKLILSKQDKEREEEECLNKQG